MVKYPFVKQEGIKDCGIACLAMIIKYYDGYISLEKLRMLTKTTKDGVNAYNLCEGAKKIGFDAWGFRTSLIDLNDKKVILPCIAHVKVNNYQHYIVIYRVDYKKKNVFVADPADKLKKINFQDFEKIWDGVIINLIPLRKIPLEKQSSFQKNIFNIIKPQSKILLHIALFSFLVTIFSCLTSLYFRTLVDNLNTSKLYLLLIFIIFVIINIIKAINIFFHNKLVIYFNQKIDMNMSSNVYDKIIELPYQYYRNRTTGEIISRFNDLNLVKGMISKLLFNLFMDLPLLIVSFVILCKIDMNLSLLLLLLIIIYVLLVLIFQPFITKYVNITQQERAVSTSTIVESVSGFETVKNLNILSYFKDKFKERYYNLLNHSFSFNNILNLKQLFNDSIFEIGTVIILFLGSLKIVSQNLTVGSLIMFYSLMLYFIDSFKNIINLDVNYKEAKNALRRITEILDQEKDSGIVCDIKNGTINYHDLTYFYNERYLALEHISFTVKKGEKVLITGGSGSGKSTLLKILMHYYEINNNQVFIDDIDLNYYKFSALKDNIIYISQNEILFSDSIINNLCLGEEKDVSEIVKLCEIDDILHKRQLNFNYIIEENGFNLSGGERQRLILGRALLKKFKILLIDEGLNQMDVNLERRILKRLFKKYSDRTIIVVSHRLDNCDLYNRHIELNKGRLVKDICKNE